MCGRFWGERWRLCPEFHVITVILTVFLRLPSKKGRRLSPPQNIRPYGLFGLTALVSVLNTVFTFIQHCSCTMDKSASLALTLITTRPLCLLLHFVHNHSYCQICWRAIFVRSVMINYCVFNFLLCRTINYMQTTFYSLCIFLCQYAYKLIKLIQLKFWYDLQVFVIEDLKWIALFKQLKLVIKPL